MPVKQKNVSLVLLLSEVHTCAPHKNISFLSPCGAVDGNIKSSLALVFTRDKYGGDPSSHGDTHLFCTDEVIQVLEEVRGVWISDNEPWAALWGGFIKPMWRTCTHTHMHINQVTHTPALLSSWMKNLSVKLITLVKLQRSSDLQMWVYLYPCVRYCSVYCIQQWDPWGERPWITSGREKQLIWYKYYGRDRSMVSKNWVVQLKSESWYWCSFFF